MRPAGEFVLSLLALMIVAIVLIAGNGPIVGIVGEVNTAACNDYVERSDYVDNLALPGHNEFDMSGGAMENEVPFDRW